MPPKAPGTQFDRGPSHAHNSKEDRMTGRIGATVEAELEQTLWRLLEGKIELHHLAPALSAWYVAGANLHGETCAQTEVDRLRRERDMWYACYTNRWTPGEYMRRQTAALWEQGAAA